MTLLISCKALEDVWLCHNLHVLFCMSMQDHRISLQVGVCFGVSKYVSLHVRTCVHQGMGPILYLCVSLFRFNPLYQGPQKGSEGKILTLSS